MIGGIVFPILVELTSNIGNYINVDGNDMLLFTVFGGITYGIGLGLIMKADFTLGGTDIITQIVSMCKPDQEYFNWHNIWIPIE